MYKKEVKKCVEEIIDSLCNRGGFDDWWYNIGEEIEEEIKNDLEKIVLERLGKNN